MLVHPRKPEHDVTGTVQGGQVTGQVLSVVLDRGPKLDCVGDGPAD